jgi:hypothetical protein
MFVQGCLDGVQIPPWNAFDNCYWEYDFSMANDLLEDNGCLVVLQGIDDAFAMELFSFARGGIMSTLAKKYICIDAIILHTKSRKVTIQAQN